MKQRVSTSLLQKLFARYTGECTILLYHHVVPKPWKEDRLDSHLYVSTEQFRNHLSYLSKHATVISIEEMTKRLERNQDLPPNSVVLTFDDGHKDNIDYAYPILKEFDFPATIYIATRFPNGDDFLWRHRLHHLLLKNENLSFEHNSKKHSFQIKTRDQKQRCFAELSGIFVRLSLPARRNLIKQLHTVTETDHPSQDNLFMSWEDIRSLHNTSLVTIGSHTRNHQMLGKLDEESARTEIRNGIQDLEKQLHNSPEYFSYPYGKQNAASVREFRLAKDLGVRNAVTTRFAHIQSEHSTHMHALPRISIDGTTSVEEVARCLTGFEAFMTQRGRRVVTD